jgi:hypothetical protein
VFRSERAFVVFVNVSAPQSKAWNKKSSVLFQSVFCADRVTAALVKSMFCIEAMLIVCQGLLKEELFAFDQAR